MTIPYFVAKYVPDVLRMEPINIGVFALQDGWVYSKFIGEAGSSPNLDLRKLRSLVQHTGTYKQWIEFWRYTISTAESPESAIALLLASSKGNYLVTQGADLSVPGEDLITGDEVVDYLFSLIVTEFSENKSDDLTLTERCADIVREFRLSANPHFQFAPSVECQITQTVRENVQPTYAYINGSEAYFQKVSLNPNRPELTQKDLHNAAWIFSKLKNRNPHCETRALVKIAGREEAVAPFLRVLQTVSNDIVDVDNDVQVHQVFSRISLTRGCGASWYEVARQNLESDVRAIAAQPDEHG